MKSTTWSPFVPSKIEEFVAHACVCAINNAQGRELVQCKKRLRDLQLQYKEVAGQLEKRKETDKKLHGKRVRYCPSCEDLDDELAGAHCHYCDDWICVGCMNECSECHKDTCSDCLQQCPGGNVLMCRDLLCVDCRHECGHCGSDSFCRDHAYDCCPEEEEDKEEPPPPPPSAKKKAKSKKTQHKK